MFQKPDREGGPREPLLTRGLLTHQSVESYDVVRRMFYGAKVSRD